MRECKHNSLNEYRLLHRKTLDEQLSMNKYKSHIGHYRWGDQKSQLIVTLVHNVSIFICENFFSHEFIHWLTLVELMKLQLSKVLVALGMCAYIYILVCIPNEIRIDLKSLSQNCVCCQHKIATNNDIHESN